jgi:hypothetical protein
MACIGLTKGIVSIVVTVSQCNRVMFFVYDIYIEYR